MQRMHVRESQNRQKFADLVHDLLQLKRFE